MCQKSLLSLDWTPHVTGAFALTFLQSQIPAPIPMAPAPETAVTVPVQSPKSPKRKFGIQLIISSRSKLKFHRQMLSEEVHYQEFETKSYVYFGFPLPAITAVLPCPEKSRSAKRHSIKSTNSYRGILI